jgi:membrane protease subunit HflK
MGFERVNPDEIIYPWKGFKLPRFSSLLIVALILVLIVLKTTFYTIQTNEVGVVLRLGKFIGTTNPGLHFKIPLGIDRVIPVKVEYIYKEEFGFRTQSPGVRTVYQQKSYDEESLMLTGDLNVLDIEWIVQFKIKDPYKVLFNIRNVQKTLRDISESVMREIVGDRTFNEVLTTKRVEVNIQAQQELQKILDSYGTGIQVAIIKLQDVNPPDSVKPAFNEVNEAKQEREKMINQAWEVYNKKIPEARGQALKIVKEAEGYNLEKVNRAKGDAERFLLLWDAYNKAKEITVRRLYLESLNDILANAGKKYIVDAEQKTILPLLKLRDE